MYLPRTQWCHQRGWSIAECSGNEAPNLTNFHSLNIGPKESDRVQMGHQQMLPSTPLLRWALAIFFLATTVGVGLYAM